MESIVDKKPDTTDIPKSEFSEDKFKNIESKLTSESKLDVVSTIINKKESKNDAEKNKSTKKQKVEEKPTDNDCDEDDEGMEERSEDESDAGSLDEFIINEDNDEDEEEEEDEDEGSETEELKLTEEEKIKRDLEDINTSNIIIGKRVRKPVKRLEDDIFNSEEYKKMILCDIPDEELDAVFSESEEEMSDEEDDEYFDRDAPEDSGEESDDESEDESEEKKHKKETKKELIKQKNNL